MTQVDTVSAMQGFCDNVAWFQQLYQFHRLSYKQGKRIEDMLCSNWTDKQWRAYVNVALQLEYGVHVVGTNKNYSQLKIAHTCISPLLFDFDTCERVCVDLRHVYISGHTDVLFDRISTQYESYEKFLKERGTHEDLLPMFS